MDDKQHFKKYYTTSSESAEYYRILYTGQHREDLLDKDEDEVEDNAKGKEKRKAKRKSKKKEKTKQSNVSMMSQDENDEMRLRITQGEGRRGRQEEGNKKERPSNQCFNDESG